VRFRSQPLGLICMPIHAPGNFAWDLRRSCENTDSYVAEPADRLGLAWSYARDGHPPSRLPNPWRRDDPRPPTEGTWPQKLSTPEERHKRLQIQNGTGSGNDSSFRSRWPVLPLWSASFAQFFEGLWSAIQAGQWVCLVGEPGSGVVELACWAKGLVARDQRSGERIMHCVDGAGSAPKGAPSWRTRIAEWESRGFGVRVFCVPSLRMRREEIPHWLEHWTAELMDPEPRYWLDDLNERGPTFESCGLNEAQVVLVRDILPSFWRQAWPGNVWQLRSLWRGLWFESNGSPSEAILRRICAQRGIAYVDRIPSKAPLDSDLAAALNSSRVETQRWNKTRAARLLGWDPDTLAARLRDRGWTVAEIPRADPWNQNRIALQTWPQGMQGGPGP